MNPRAGVVGGREQKAIVLDPQQGQLRCLLVLAVIYAQELAGVSWITPAHLVILGQGGNAA